jgi:hypothetical protein
VTADAELALVRLRSALFRVQAAGAGSVVPGQVTRLYGVLTGEVHADAPIPGLARAAGSGLVEIATSAGGGAEVRSNVDELLELLEAQERVSPVEAPRRAAPDLPQAAEAANEPVDEAGPPDTGTVGIGVPILPDD